MKDIQFICNQIICINDCFRTLALSCPALCKCNVVGSIKTLAKVSVFSSKMYIDRTKLLISRMIET